MHGTLLGHVPHDYCTLENPSHCMHTFYSAHIIHGYVYAHSLQYMVIIVHWYSTIHQSTRGLLGHPINIEFFMCIIVRDVHSM